jgi:alginate O-acetyltransferase complex protein AlgI
LQSEGTELGTLLFCSFPFLIFFVAVLAVYWALPWDRARVWWLLAASIYFYASWNPWLAALVCFSSSFDYAIGRGLESPAWGRWRRWLLAASLGANLGLLGTFKYANFFLRSLEDALTAAGATASLPLLKVVLPIGISFYTFEAISYTVDVYRRRVAAERNLANFMLFILFFPHLVAGPIVRPRRFLPQVRRPKRFDWARCELGCQLWILGLFKKLVIADRMALIVDPVFAAPGEYSRRVLWAALFAYSLQIYCDFSGYSDMALGSARLLGYRLPRNFAMPYAAPNVTEFWRRWHISLSTWLRDYLYIPLGGNRGSRGETERNLLVTMTLGGLWHGASWHFAAWGLMHGLCLVVHRRFVALRRRLPTLDRLAASPIGRGLSVAVTFAVVTVLWTLFRAPTPLHAVTVLARLLPAQGGRPMPVEKAHFQFAVVAVLLGHVVGALWKRGRVWAIPPPVRGALYAFGLTATLLLAVTPGKTFVYFQF